MILKRLYNVLSHKDFFFVILVYRARCHIAWLVDSGSEDCASYMLARLQFTENDMGALIMVQCDRDIQCEGSINQGQFNGGGGES